MAINVKDSMGNTENVSSNAKGNLGVALGGTALGLGVLNGGFGNLLNGVGTNGNGGGTVNITKYYEDRIQDLKDISGQFTDVRDAMCGLKERVAVNETANHYQNLMTAQAFGFVDTRFATERLVTDYEIGARTCDFLKATKVMTPAQIGNTYANPTMVLDQHEIRYLEEERRPRGFNEGCNGYRGF